MDTRRGSLVRWVFVVLALVCVVGGPFVATAQAQPDPRGPVVLYFFWGEDCPHCAAAKPVLADLKTRYPQLEVHAFEVWTSPENRQLLIDMATEFGFTATGVPTFFLGREYWVGFMREVTARQLEAAVQNWLASGCPDAGAGVMEPDRPPAQEPGPNVQESGPDPLRLPFVGEVDLGSQSLVATTLLIAVVDGFNPCSLWVLSVLPALTLRTQSRRKIAVIGSVYIFVSALVAVRRILLPAMGVRIGQEDGVSPGGPR